MGGWVGAVTLKRLTIVLPVIKHIDIFSENLNLEGHLNRCIGSKVTVVLLNGWIMPTG